MSVEERLVRYAESVAHRLTEVDQENLTARIGQELVEWGGGAIEAASPPREVDEDGDPSNEPGSDSEHRLRRLLVRHEKEGDADSALKIALLLEALERAAEARTWWIRAAELGNADADDYVDAYFRSTTVTAAPPVASEIRVGEPLGRGNSQAGRG